MPLIVSGWEAPGKREEIEKAMGVEPDQFNNLLYLFGVTCMTVGMRELTDANFKQFAARVNFIERLTGEFMSNEDGPLKWSEEALTAFKGVGANVATETRAAWLKRQTQYMGL